MSGPDSFIPRAPTLPRTLKPALVAMLCCAFGCAAYPVGKGASPQFDPSLLSGERLFEAPISDAEIPTVDVLQVDAAMREFVRTHVRLRSLARKRLGDLLRGMVSVGLAGPDYDADRTLTAAETFHAGSGNCLSFTNMFIALAREAGLEAVYQVVDVAPDWDVDSGFLIRYTHVNVLVRNVRLGQRFDNAVTVDFNEVRPAPDFRRRIISDAHAQSLYYANHAVSLIRAGDARRGFGYLRRAIEMAPQNADLWINLGALYATEGDNDSSMDAYQVALQIDPNNRAAMSGLARGYERAGDEKRAAFYRKRVKDYLESNPYYHYAVARTAFEEGSDAQALEAVQAAIALSPGVGRFHFLEGLIEQRMGNDEAARTSFREAERLGLESEAKMAYIRDLSDYGPR